VVSKRRSHISTRAKKNAFIEAYAITGVITSAAKCSGVGRRTYYEWIDADPDFKLAAETAFERSVDSLEDAAIDRARSGVQKQMFHNGQPILDENGNKVYEYKYSDVLLIFLLKCRRPAVYGERTEQVVTHEFKQIHQLAPAERDKKVKKMYDNYLKVAESA